MSNGEIVRSKYWEIFTKAEFSEKKESGRFLDNIMKKGETSPKRTKETVWYIKVNKKSVIDKEKEEKYKKEKDKLMQRDCKFALSGKKPWVWRWAFNPID